ncbi:MAG: NADH-quinone oxidoreductase subunit M [Acidobacteriota bacterium]|jgi:NADH-quinone oxidoreductase subunit M
MLSLITYLPLLAAVVLMFVPKNRVRFFRYFATAAFFVDFLVSLPLWFGWATAPVSANGMWRWEESFPWIQSLGVSYHFGVDGLSSLLILLTTLLGTLAAWSSWKYIKDREKEYYVWLLILQTGMIGVFCSLDLFLFYIFWEVMLVPMYFLIGIWGGSNKLYAAIKFFLYTLAGSVVMLIGILVLYFHTPLVNGHHSFNLDMIYKVHLPPELQWWVFGALFLGFAIKVPMFPFHTWLPDAHTEAPTAGSVILAGVLLKMGTYGFFRFSLPILPDATLKWLPFLLVLAIIGVIYGAMVSLVQKDMKRLVAYSSVSHLGFCMAGMFTLTVAGLKGSILQMINHGITTGGLFLLVGIIYERMHTRLIREYGGLAKLMPVFAAFFMFITLASIGLPGLNGFVGEIIILLGAYQMPAYLVFSKSLIFFLVTGMLLGAAYMLWMYQRVFFGEVKNPALPEHVKGKDMSKRELGYMIPLVILALWIGLYPKPILNRMNDSVNFVMARLRPAMARVEAQKDHHIAATQAVQEKATTGETPSAKAGKAPAPAVKAKAGNPAEALPAKPEKARP